MEISIPSRRIVYNEESLAIINPEASIEENVKMHAAAIPALATAAIEGPVLSEGVQTYTVTTRLGTKG